MKLHLNDDQNYSSYQIIPQRCYRVDEFCNSHFFYYGYSDCHILVLKQNKYIKKPPNISQFKYFDYWHSKNKGIDDYWEYNNKDSDDYIETNEDEEFIRECCYSTFRMCTECYALGPDLIYYDSENDDDSGLFNPIVFVRICMDKANEIN